MNDILGKVVSILLCAYLMFFYPLNVMRDENRQLEKMYLYSETIEFIDGIRNTGILHSRDMIKYMDKVSSMGELYHMQIMHKSTIISEDEQRILSNINYNEQISRVLEKENQYLVQYNDFVKIVIMDKDENLIVCYGGSVKADHSEKEVLQTE